MPKKEILYRQIIGADGTVKLVDAKGKELSVRKGKPVRGSAEPDARQKDLVVLPLPYRSADHVAAHLKLEKKSVGDLRLAEALPLFAAHIGGGQRRRLERLPQRHLPPRTASARLLCPPGRGRINLDSENANVLGSHPDETVAQYLALHSSPCCAATPPSGLVEHDVEGAVPARISPQRTPSSSAGRTTASSRAIRPRSSRNGTRRSTT